MKSLVEILLFLLLLNFSVTCHEERHKMSHNDSGTARNPAILHDDIKGKCTCVTVSLEIIIISYCSIQAHSPSP